MKLISLLILLCTVLGLYAISTDDIRFLSNKEQFALLTKHPEDILVKALTGNKDEVNAVLQYAQVADLPGLAIQCLKTLATEYASLENALQWYLLKQTSEVDSLEFAAEIADVEAHLSTPLDKQVFSRYTDQSDEAALTQAIMQADTYNSVVEALAKSIIDEISTTRSDSLALNMIDDFFATYPNSKYEQIALYYKFYHLSNQKNWDAVFSALPALDNVKPVPAYVSALFLLSPTLRKSYSGEINVLELAAKYLEKAELDEPQTLLYDVYTASDWLSRTRMQQVKLDYYLLLQGYGMFGDEPQIQALDKLPKQPYKKLLQNLDKIAFSNNDRGEQAELYYWKAKVNLLNKTKKTKLLAAKQLTECLCLGAPRKRYDSDAYELLTKLYKDLKIKPLLKEITTGDTELTEGSEFNTQTLFAWMRKLMKYKGIQFDDVSARADLTNKGYSRVALGDYNGDGNIDILFTGKHLLANNGNLSFTDVSQAAGLTELNSAGGLFADFNQDGLLDLATYSHADDGNGEKLLKNMDKTRFVNVNERAGDIDDKYPSEAAAWIDTESKGYPSLYVANYEKWQERSGYPDFFWHNEAGYFSNKSQTSGFRLPLYTDNPGQAGRGVAPADFDNDGQQEIFVTNYRLNRNFCWKQTDTLFVDVAPLYGLAGKFKNGYYGHSIGADWGDFDNDGDLDVFIANLAHPRFLDISDISMLLRNDGLASRIVDADTLYYWQFTDVTSSAGITYDELHSDPLFFDADNDGYLDLFITSVYENERSYLYHNNGDGTFTDVTWLSGARVYNGWGNASGDLDRDGLLDLVVGSGSGAKMLCNRTITPNKAVYIKPVWKSGQIHLETGAENFAKLPNSPAFGTRVIVTLQTPKGKVIKLMRELASAKGTGSQSAQELHFGLGRNKLLEIKRFTP